MYIGIIDQDALLYKKNFFPNLEVMKISSYHKAKRDIVDFILNMTILDKYSKIYLRKNIQDNYYPSFVISKDNCDYGGLSFTNNQYIPMTEEIENTVPDFSIYNNYMKIIKPKCSYGLKEEELSKRFVPTFLNQIKSLESEIFSERAISMAFEHGASAMQQITSGGILATLWEMAEAAGVGLDIDLKKIPIRQETVESCEFFDINPYKLLSGGSLLLAAADGNQMVRELEQAGIASTIIGKTTDGNDRVLRQMEERRFLETAQTDELYKILKGE